MGQNETGRAPGQGSTAGRDDARTGKTYGSGEGEASASDAAPWFKFWLAPWWRAVRGLDPDEVGVLLILSMQMHDVGAPLQDPDARLARLCGVGKAAFVRIKNRLLADGRLVVSRGGLWNQLIETEIKNRQEKSQKASEAANVRHGKHKQNQTGGDADALRTECEVRGEEVRGERAGGLSPPVPPIPSQPSSPSKIDAGDRGLADAAAPPVSQTRYRVGDKVEHSFYGTVTVTKVLPKQLHVRTLHGEHIPLGRESDGSMLDWDEDVPL